MVSCNEFESCELYFLRSKIVSLVRLFKLRRLSVKRTFVPPMSPRSAITFSGFYLNDSLTVFFWVRFKAK